MSIGVMRAQKIKGGSDTVGLQIHNRRERGNSNTNPDIKHDLTAQNYSLRDTERSYNEAIERRMKEGYKAQKAPRKDAVRLVELLFTSDSEFFARLTAEQEREFFRDCYKFASKQFGEDNIIAATVHKDEKTPHLHLDFVPLTSDGRLSAKDVLGDKYALQRLQDAFNSVVGAKWGLSRGNRADLSEEKPRKHTKTEDYKRQLATECAQLEQTVSSYDKKIRQIESETTVATTQLADINSQITEKTAELQNLSNLKTNISGMYNEIDRFKADKKSIPFSKPKRVSVDEKQLDEIIELAKQGLSERTKNYRLMDEMRDMVSPETHKSKLKERDDEISSLKDQLNTCVSTYNRVKQAVHNLHLGSQINEELRRMQSEEQEQSRSSEREQQTQQKKKSSPKR